MTNELIYMLTRFIICNEYALTVKYAKICKNIRFGALVIIKSSLDYTPKIINYNHTVHIKSHLSERRFVRLNIS